MRWIGIVGFFAVLAPVAANGQDAACRGFLEAADAATAARNEQPFLFLTGNRCEAIESKELRAPLLRIPQDDEDPMELSLGVKSSGGMIRLKIPFSF